MGTRTATGTTVHVGTVAEVVLFVENPYCHPAVILSTVVAYLRIENHAVYRHLIVARREIDLLHQLQVWLLLPSDERDDGVEDHVVLSVKQGELIIVVAGKLQRLVECDFGCLARTDRYILLGRCVPMLRELVANDIQTEAHRSVVFAALVLNSEFHCGRHIGCEHLWCGLHFQHVELCLAHGGVFHIVRTHLNVYLICRSHGHHHVGIFLLALHLVLELCHIAAFGERGRHGKCGTERIEILSGVCVAAIQCLRCHDIVAVVVYHKSEVLEVEVEV